MRIKHSFLPIFDASFLARQLFFIMILSLSFRYRATHPCQCIDVSVPNWCIDSWEILLWSRYYSFIAVFQLHPSEECLSYEKSYKWGDSNPHSTDFFCQIGYWIQVSWLLYRLRYGTCFLKKSRFMYLKGKLNTNLPARIFLLSGFLIMYLNKIPFGTLACRRGVPHNSSLTPQIAAALGSSHSPCPLDWGKHPL